MFTFPQTFFTALALTLLVVLGVVVTLLLPLYNSFGLRGGLPVSKHVSRWLKSLVVDEIGGYVHDTAMAMFIAPSNFLFSAGTWTATVASNTWFMRRTAADANATVYVPVRLMSNSAAQKGAYLTSIDVWYNVTVAALDDFATVALYYTTLPATGSAPAATAIPQTQDAAHDTAAERKATGQHKMTVTLTTPIWIDDDQAVHLEMVLDNSATSVIDFYGARANFTLRI